MHKGGCLRSPRKLLTLFFFFFNASLGYLVAPPLGSTWHWDLRNKRVMREGNLAFSASVTSASSDVTHYHTPFLCFCINM